MVCIILGVNMEDNMNQGQSTSGDSLNISGELKLSQQDLGSPNKISGKKATRYAAILLVAVVAIFGAYIYYLENSYGYAISYQLNQTLCIYANHTNLTYGGTNPNVCTPGSGAIPIQTFNQNTTGINTSIPIQNNST